MTQKNPRRDLNQLAKLIVDQATGEVEVPAKTAKQLNSAKGGIKGSAVRAEKLTPQQRSEIASLAAQARWKKAN
jgi:hypothetical protein